jgi:hypothetical protein
MYVFETVSEALLPAVPLVPVVPLAPLVPVVLLLPEVPVLPPLQPFNSSTNASNKSHFTLCIVINLSSRLFGQGLIYNIRVNYITINNNGYTINIR